MATSGSPRYYAIVSLLTHIGSLQDVVDILEGKEEFEAAERKREMIFELRRALEWLETHPQEDSPKITSEGAIGKTEEELKRELFGIYINGLGEYRGYYANQAEESGLLAVYKAGVKAGEDHVADQKV